MTPRTLHVLTHAVSPRLPSCALTYRSREAIDVERARRQQESLDAWMESCGARVRRLEVNPDRPDSCFIEDLAVVWDELIVVGRPGISSRRTEPDGLEPSLAGRRPLHRVRAPATLEGGDVLTLGKTVYVGLSARTNSAGAAFLRSVLEPHGYRVISVPVRGALHLKTGCSGLGGESIWLNDEWIDPAPFEGRTVHRVPRQEPGSANVLVLGNRVALHSGFPRAAERLRGFGLDVTGIDLGEFLKAEAGPTCLTLPVPGGLA